MKGTSALNSHNEELSGFVWLVGCFCFVLFWGFGAVVVLIK